MKRFDRRALFATGAAAALLAASGVSAAPKRGGLLRAALSGATRQDTWSVLGGRFHQTAATSLFEGLTELAADGTLRGELATAWHASEGGRVWDFTLRDATFHDGIPLLAADVASSLAPCGVVEATETGVRITLQRADANLPYHLAHPAYLIKPADPVRRAAGIGTGLYRLRKFAPGTHFIADRVSAHWKDGIAGWFDRIEFVHFGDDSVRAQALREGLVDVADIATLSDIGDARDFQRLPDSADVTQVASHRIGVPLQMGRAFPLDNLRMTERWWIA